MAGLARICRMYGRMKVGNIMWVWDYHNEKPVKQEEMPDDSEAWKLSEKTKCEKMKKELSTINKPKGTL